MTRLSQVTGSVRGEIRYQRVRASPLLYGAALNRWKGEASVLHVKPLSNIVEANITLETGGSF